MGEPLEDLLIINPTGCHNLYLHVTGPHRVSGVSLMADLLMAEVIILM